MSLFVGNENLISVDNMNNFLSLEQRNKYKYNIHDAVHNESKSNSDNNDDNNNNYNDNSKHDNKNYNNDNDNDSKGNSNNSDDTNNKFNNGNSNDKNDQNKDEIVSIMLGTAVNSILNSISFYNKPVKDVLDNYDVNYKSECLGLVIIRVKSSQNLNFVESNMFCHYYDKKLEFAQLSENIKNEHNIPFNSEYIKAESKVSQCKVNKFEFESEYIESEYIVKKSTLRVAVKFKKKTHLLIHCQFVYHLLVPCNSTCSISLLIHLQNNSSSFSNFP